MNYNTESIFDYHDLIAAIVSTVEARDRHTSHHSTRVSDMAEYICLLLNMNKEDTLIIHIAADLHDIGKIGIADSILLKTGGLTREEWTLMKSHTEIGYSILNKVERFVDIAKIVRHHHERWDGTGYPDRLAKQDIPVGSRIIAIADSIDAMLADRSYRKGLTAKECRIEIEKNIGKMYDERIASVVLNNWEDVLLVRHKTI